MGLALSNKKSKLVQKGEDLKASLKNDLDVIKQNSKDIAVNGIVVVSVVAIGIIFYKLLSGNDHSEKMSTDDSKIVVVNSEPSNSIFKSIITSITLFLLNIAKDKLLEQLDLKLKSQPEKSE